MEKELRDRIKKLEEEVIFWSKDSMGWRMKCHEMQERLDWLQALENAGVDNWEGISFAYELLEEME